MDQTTSLSFSYNMSEVTLKDNRQYLFPASPPLLSNLFFSTIIKFFDDLVWACPEHLDEYSRDYAKTLLTF